jgi:hypothetical protein
MHRDALVQAHHVDRPAIDGNGADALWGLRGGFAQTLVEPGQDAIQRPVHMAAAQHRSVGDAVKNLDAGQVALPPQ